MTEAGGDAICVQANVGDEADVARLFKVGQCRLTPVQPRLDPGLTALASSACT